MQKEINDLKVTVYAVLLFKVKSVLGFQVKYDKHLIWLDYKINEDRFWYNQRNCVPFIRHTEKGKITTFKVPFVKDTTFYSKNEEKNDESGWMKIINEITTRCEKFGYSSETLINRVGWITDNKNEKKKSVIKPMFLGG